MVLKDLLEKLNLSSVWFLCKKYGLDYDPTFVAYINLDDGYRRLIIYEDKAGAKKKWSWG